jgi:Zn-dependent M28 family amino/carboxypeptidase
LLFSTGEEQGTLGFKGLLDQLTLEELSSIKYVINVDMIGYDENDDHVMEIWHGGHSSSLAFAGYFRDIINTYKLDLQPKLVVGCG